MKRSLSVLLIVLLVITAIPLGVFANGFEARDYVSLGDSNAFGSGLQGIDEGPSYFDILSGYFAKPRNGGYDAVNLADDGKSSWDLLEDLEQNTDDTADYVEAAKLITISIGGNNLLSPVLDGIYEYYDGNPVTEPYIDPDLPGDEKLRALSEAINDYPAYWAGIVLPGLTASLEPGKPLNLALQDGVQQFINQWPQIMAKINVLNPDARIYVVGLYNPLSGDPQLGPQFEKLILPMNAAMRLTPLKYRNVRFIGTDLLFRLYPKSISFDLSIFPATPESIDPHPTKVGHAVIANAILLKDKLFR